MQPFLFNPKPSHRHKRPKPLNTSIKPKPFEQSCPRSPHAPRASAPGRRTPSCPGCNSSRTLGSTPRKRRRYFAIRIQVSRYCMSFGHVISGSWASPSVAIKPASSPLYLIGGLRDLSGSEAKATELARKASVAVAKDISLNDSAGFSRFYWYRTSQSKHRRQPCR